MSGVYSHLSSVPDGTFICEVPCFITETLKLVQT
eukprot:COSAG05_NODE_18656_length_305_cov_0.703883_1_plen_33_part_01